MTTAWRGTGDVAVEDESRPLQLAALCVDADSGVLLHQIPLFQIDHAPTLHPLNSYASPTPVIEGELVVCSFGAMGTACIDRKNGRVVWSRDHFELDHETGPGSSPVIWRDLVILHLDGTDRQSIAALHLDSGDIAWETARSGELHPDGMMRKAFCTPLVISDPGGDVIVSVAANWVYGYDAASGTELWRKSYGQLGFSNVPRPLYVDGRLFVCTGYNRASLVAYDFPDGIRAAPNVAWQVDQKVPNMPTPIWIEGLLIMVSDDGIATALRGEDGSRLWQQRIGGNFSASPVLAGEWLVLGNRDGTVIIVRPGERFEEAGRFQLDAALMATPACTPEAMFLRTASSLYRLGTVDAGIRPAQRP